MPSLPDLLDGSDPSCGDRAMKSETGKEVIGEPATETCAPTERRSDAPLVPETEEHGRAKKAKIDGLSLAVSPFPQVPVSTAQPLLHFQHVSKWYGPVIGVNQVTLELRPGITGLVGANGA